MEPGNLVTSIGGLPDSKIVKANYVRVWPESRTWSHWV